MTATERLRQHLLRGRCACNRQDRSVQHFVADFFPERAWPLPCLPKPRAQLHEPHCRWSQQLLPSATSSDPWSCSPPHHSLARVPPAAAGLARSIFPMMDAQAAAQAKMRSAHFDGRIDMRDLCLSVSVFDFRRKPNTTFSRGYSHKSDRELGARSSD